MMSTFDFSSVKKENALFVIEDFNKFTKNSKGFSIVNGLKEEKDVLLNLDFNVNVNKVFYANGKLLIYADDNLLYYVCENELKPLLSTKFEKIKSVISGIYNGKESLYVFGDNNFVVTNSNSYSFNVFDCDKYYFHNGRLIGILKDEIYFGGEFDYAEDSVNVKSLGVFNINKEYGKIIELVSLNKFLYVFCQNAILRFTADGNFSDFKFTKLELEELNIADNSVKKIGDSVYFLNDDKLCVFNKSEIKKVSTVLDELSGFTNNGVYRHFNKYLLNYFLNGSSFVFLFDTLNYDNYLLETNGFISDNGYLVDNVNKKIKKLLNLNVNKTWVSKKMDFGVYKEKTIYKIAVDTINPIKITLKGDFGEKTLTYYNKEIYVGLTSNKFQFLINSTNSDDNVSSVKLYYRY